VFTGNRLGRSDGNRVDEKLEGTDRVQQVMTMDMPGGKVALALFFKSSWSRSSRVAWKCTLANGTQAAPKSREGR